VAAHALPDPRALLATVLLDTRTRNVLLRSLPAAGDRTPWTVARYLGVPGFGARGLLDALTSLQAAAASGGGAKGATGTSGGLGVVLPRIEAVQRRHRREDLRPAPQRLAPVSFADAAAIERAMAAIAADLPLSEEDAAARLGPAGVDLPRLLGAASRMGMKPPFMLLAQGGGRLAVRRTDVPLATTTYAIAVRMTYNAGAATVAALASRVSAVMEVEVAPAFLLRVLSAVRGFAWLDGDAGQAKADGWFWFRERPSRLKEALAKVFAAVTWLPLGTLGDALSRGVDAALRAPPAAIEAVGLTLPGARLEAGALAIPKRLDRSVYLSDGERALVEVLERAGRPLPVQALRDVAALRPLAPAALLRLVRSSPLFEALPGDLCGLVGASLDDRARTLSA